MNATRPPDDELLAALLARAEEPSEEGGAAEHLTDEAISVFATGCMSPDERGRAVQHLSQCARCRKAVSFQLAYQAEPDAAAELLAQVGSNDGDVSLRRGGLLLSLGRIQDAITEFQSAVARAPSDPQAWFYLGQAHQAAQAYPQAEETLRRCLELEPTHTMAMSRLTVVLEQQGKQAEAADLWRRLLTGKPLERQPQQIDRSAEKADGSDR